MGEPRVVTADQVTGPAAEHGEGPVWDAGAGVLRYVDMLRGDLLTFHPALATDDPDRLTRTHVADVLAALRPRRDGGWVVATERGFALTDAGSWVARPIAEAFTDPAIRLNEGGCDAAGGFYCGSMAYAKTPGAATLYRLSPEGSVSVILDGITISNGFCLDAAGAIAYYIDTPTRRIDVFDVGADGATLSGRRPFVTMEAGGGSPDGLTVDADGRVWVALYGGGAVRAYSPGGRLEVVVPIPTPHVTACAFGGPDLRDLFITTSQEDIDTSRDPIAGALFHAVPGPRGQLPRPFAG